MRGYINRAWEGRTVVVLANGPSMSHEVANQARGHPTIAVNDAFMVAPWADMLYAADAKWWYHKRDLIQTFRGVKVSCADMAQIPGLISLTPSGVTGFDPHPGRIRTGNNSGYQAVHVAITTGAARILLCGFDMHGDHWFGKHPAPLANPVPSDFQNWVKNFETLKGHEAEIINCTLGSALRCFPFMELSDGLRQAQNQEA